MENESKYILEIDGLKKWFALEKKLFSNKRQYVKAVNGVSFKIKKGEILGIVGESGCGKTTLGRTMIRLLEPTEGSLIFEGKNILALSDKEMHLIRKDIQIMFQDPYSSLNPRMTVADIIAEPMDIHKTYLTQKERLEKVIDLMDICGLDKIYINRFPHEFSGGQRQRIGIARALALNPKMIICDEPVSALDVSIQSQIINLLKGLQKRLALTLIFISHDLSVVKHISDRIAVMYLGKVVELADKKALFGNPRHPYTISLLNSIPKIGEKLNSNKKLLEGDIPSPVNPPSGCTFHTRCPIATEECKLVEPELIAVDDEHFASCIKLRAFR